MSNKFDQPRDQKNAQFIQMLKIKFSFDIQIMDDMVLRLLVKFFAFQSVYIFLQNDNQYDKTKENLILPTQNHVFGNSKTAQIPMFILEDMIEFNIFINQLMHKILRENLQFYQYYMELILIIMGNKQIVSNPHIRAKCLILINMVQQKNSKQENNFVAIYYENQFFQQYLVSSLFNIFIDVEKTGSNNQFYEKFSYRYYFGQIFYKIFNDPKKGQDFVDQFKKIIQDNQNKFLAFINLYMNDLIYLLDECLQKLKEIKSLDDQQEQLSQEQQQQYQQNKRIVKQFLDFLTCLYKNLNTMTFLSPKSFMSPEILDKLVLNLNYTVQQLNGKDSLQFKVKDMKKLHFEPKFILTSIVKVYLNLDSFNEFYESVVNDTRSFQIDNFQTILFISKRENLLNEDQLHQFSKLLDSLHLIKENKQKFDINMSDAPEEFLDPLMQEIMKDPVLLPSSNMILDRVTIMKHLLSDETDPFNRSKLTKDMLIPQNDLKQKIEQYIASKQI